VAIEADVGAADADAHVASEFESDLEADIPCEQLANADCSQDPRCALEGRFGRRGKTGVRCVFRDAQSTCNFSLSDNWNSRFLQWLFKSQRQFREISTFFL